MFNRLDQLATTELYLSVPTRIVDTKGEKVYNEQTGEEVIETRWLCQVPVINRFLGALEEDPITVTGTLHAMMPDGAVKLFDLDAAYGYLTLEEVYEVYLAGHQTARAVNFQTTRGGVQEGQLINLDWSDKAREVAVKHGLQHQYRKVVLASGVSAIAGKMEVVIAETAIAAALSMKHLKTKGRLTNMDGPARPSTKENPHIGEIIKAIAETGKMPAKVVHETARQQVRSDIVGRLADGVGEDGMFVATVRPQNANQPRWFPRNRN